jgi:hypothetical protein
MNKKTGLILMFVGAYVVLLGGLFWNMSTKVHNTYDWFWGLSAGVVIACGAALAIKKNFLAYIGFGIVLVGIAYTIYAIISGFMKSGHLSVWMIVGASVALLGLIFGVVFHIFDAIRIKKYGPTLL